MQLLRAVGSIPEKAIQGEILDREALGGLGRPVRDLQNAKGRGISDALELGDSLYMSGHVVKASWYAEDPD
jgi:hypothetical protein